jgi:hypothetical protein
MKSGNFSLIISTLLSIVIILPATSSNIFLQKNDLLDELTSINNIMFDKYQTYISKRFVDTLEMYPTMKSRNIYSLPEKNPPSFLAKNIPSEFSWKEYNGSDWTTPAKEQLCGDCWAFATLAMTESIIEIRENCSLLNPDLSEQYLLSCLDGAGDCNGGSPYNALELIINTSNEGNNCNGIIPESCFPYQGDDTIPCSEKCDKWIDFLIPLSNVGYWWSYGNADDIDIMKSWILKHGPITSCFYASDYFINWGHSHHHPNDVFRYYTFVVPSQNHIIQIVGWKDDPTMLKGGYWICKNSWGTDWGYDGFFNIEFNALSIDIGLIVWVDYDPNSYDWPPVANAGEPCGGSIGQEIIFDAKRSFDPEDNIVCYNWDFGDGTNGSGTTVTHAFSQLGTYNVTLIVIDSENKKAYDTIKVWIQEFNNPANKPTIKGKLSGEIGKRYEYTFSSTDPEGNDVYYYIDWGDDSFEEWLGPFNSGTECASSHIWYEEGIYKIKAKARDVFGEESIWGELTVSIPKYKSTSLFHWSLEQHPRLFPLLKQLLIKL